MKKHIIAVFSTVILLFSLSPVAIAETTPETTPTPTITTTKTLQQRIDEYKAKVQLKLTTADKTKLKAKCKAAQAIIKQRQIALEKVSQARLKAYEKIDQKLTEVINQLKAQNIDVEKLQAEQKTLELKIGTFKNDIATYKQALSDSGELDCTADPTAFKSALQTARAAHQKVSDDAKDIRTYITETIIKTLTDIQSQLSSNNGGTQ